MDSEQSWRAREHILAAIAGSLRSGYIDPEPIITILREYPAEVRVISIRDWTSEVLLPFLLYGMPLPVLLIETIITALVNVPESKTISARANDIATFQLLERAGVTGVSAACDPLLSPELDDWPAFSEWAAAAHHLAIPDPLVPEDFSSESVREALDSGIVLAMLENDGVRAAQLLRWDALMPPAARAWRPALEERLSALGMYDVQIALTHAIWSKLASTR